MLTFRPAIAKLYSLSYLWYSLVAVLVVCTVGLITSFITGKCPYETHMGIPDVKCVFIKGSMVLQKANAPSVSHVF